MRYLTNAFSIQMIMNLLRYDKDVIVQFRLLEYEEVKEMLLTREFVNAIGHQGTVDFLNRLFGLNLSVERKQITVNHGDVIIIVMPVAGRLPPGTELTAEKMMELYEQGLVRFIKVTIP
jgi:hypothetical protein